MRRLVLFTLVLAACQRAPQSGADGGLGSCHQASECTKSNPDECNICQDTRLVCVDQQCQCACTAPVDAAVAGCNIDTECVKSNPDECNICQDTRLVCVQHQCQCSC